MMGSNVEALTGQSVEIRPLDPSSGDLGKRFGSRQLYLFPIADHASNPLNALLALDFSGAVHTGASFSLMGAEQVKEVLSSKQVPEILHDSIGEVANILCGAALDYVRENSDENPEFRRGDEFELIRAKPWPDLLERVGTGVEWQVIGGELLIDGEEKGALLLAAGEQAEASEDTSGETTQEPARAAGSGVATVSTGQADADGVAASEADSAGPEGSSQDSASAAEGGSVSAGGVETGADDAGTAPRAAGEGTDAAPAAPTASSSAPSAEELRDLHVALACQPADPNALRLRDQLEDLVAQTSWLSGSDGGAEVVIVISRSATDLEARVRSIASGESPPPLIVGCSDRPTRELVMAARRAGVGAFLVLPTGSSQLKEVLARVPQPA